MSEYGLCTVCVKRKKGCKSFKRWLKLGQKVAICTDFTKIKTNADRIRAMSDEELAKYINELSNGDCPTVGDCPEGLRENETCTPWQCWLFWLKAPVEEVQK